MTPPSASSGGGSTAPVGVIVAAMAVLLIAVGLGVAIWFKRRRLAQKPPSETKPPAIFINPATRFTSFGEGRTASAVAQPGVTERRWLPGVQLDEENYVADPVTGTNNVYETAVESTLPRGSIVSMDAHNYVAPPQGDASPTYAVFVGSSGGEKKSL
jgi:hypothetical protein